VPDGPPIFLTSFHPGQYAQARARMEEALVLFRAVGDRPFVGWVLSDLGDVLRITGDLVGARAWLREALQVLRDAGSIAI
jgi:hypothetical protein